MTTKRKSETAVAESVSKAQRLSSDETAVVGSIKLENGGKQPVASTSSQPCSSGTRETYSRAKRLIRPPNKDYGGNSNPMQVGYRSRFSTSEKERLLAALKRHGPDDYDILAKSVQTRSPLEIKWFIDSKKITRAVPSTKNNEAKSAPIQQWLGQANELTRNTLDYSYMLSQVMSIAGQYESRKTSKHAMTPNYSAIYAYITQLLEGTFPDVTKLKPIDAVVILDLLEGLKEELKSSDLTEQFRLMRKKYELLSTKVTTANPNAAYIAVARALQDDLLEAEDSEGSFLGGSPGKRPVSSAVGSPSTASSVSTTGSVPSTYGKAVGEAQSSSENDKLATDVVRPQSATESDNVNSSASSQIPDTPSNDKTGGNSAAQQAAANVDQTPGAPGITMVTMPQTDSTKIDGAECAQANIDINETTSVQSGPSPDAKANDETSETANAQGNFSGTVEGGTSGNAHTAEARRGQPKGLIAGPTKQGRYPVIEAKKSKLYALNPFAIGVKYLRPQKKTAKTAENTAAFVPNVAAGFSSPS